MAYLTEKSCLFIGENVVTIPVKIEVLFIEIKKVRVIFSLQVTLVMAG